MDTFAGRREDAHVRKFAGKIHRKPLVKDEVLQTVVNISEQLSKRSSRSSIAPNTENSTEEKENHPAIHRQPEQHVLVEADALKAVRRRTFSHWPHRGSLGAAVMCLAGFFCCNVGDRVICLYCNLICQQWTLDVDDPQEVHQTLSPQCPHVLCMTRTRETVPVSILNENGNAQSPVLNTLQSNDIAYTVACHPNYSELPKRYASFASWPSTPSPPVDELVRAGFFYTGTQTVTTCFYCNGSLQNWGAGDNPSVEHCRWFPHCVYAKQLCGDELYRRVQESKRIQQGLPTFHTRTLAQFCLLERTEAMQSNDNGGDHANNKRRLLVADEATLSRLVAARLDLPISQSLLKGQFKSSVIKRVWEDQLRIKQDDFVSDCDLFIACLILQKQIDCINGKKENIVIPSARMTVNRAEEQPAQSATMSEVPTTKDIATTNAETKKDPEDSPSPLHLCTLCLTEEKRLACFPCGHVATCVPCGHSLRICPICRKEINGFVRVYL